MRRPALLAVDGGGSKLDAALLGRDGTVLGAGRVRAEVFGQPGDEPFLDQVANAVAAAAEDAGLDADVTPIAPVGVFCLAGADLPADDRRIMRGLARRAWTQERVLRNDTFAVLRAGTDRSWGIGVVCGFGTNCTGVSPDGRVYRLPAVGGISGDWGGGGDIGEAALWHAIRAIDGRGRRTSLSRSIPDHFGMRTTRQVMEALYRERLDGERLAELAPVVFRDARAGDPIALEIVNRQADEIAMMVSAASRRLGLRDLDPDVVLGGGIFRNGWEPFFRRIDDGVREVTAAARVVHLTTPPVVGAAMLGLDLLGTGKAAHHRTRSALTHERLTQHTRPRRSA